MKRRGYKLVLLTAHQPCVECVRQFFECSGENFAAAWSLLPRGDWGCTDYKARCHDHAVDWEAEVEPRPTVYRENAIAGAA